MNRLFNYTSCVTAFAGGFFTFLFGVWDGALKALIVLMVLDYITGIIKAIYKRELSSRTGFDGLMKKIVIMIVVALANIVQSIVAVPVAIREVVIMFYAANEGISILENAAVVIPKMPDCIKRVLLQLRNEE